MKLKMTALVLALSAGLGSVAQTAAAASAPYEFSYVNEQPPASDLVQVFNDGTTTFFQFKRMPLNPKITIVRGGKEIAVNFEANPPYLMVPGIEAEYFVLVGESLSHVLYRGQRHEIREIKQLNSSVGPNKHEYRKTNFVVQPDRRHWPAGLCIAKN